MKLTTIDTITRVKPIIESKLKYNLLNNLPTKTKTIKCGDNINMIFDDATGNIISINGELEKCIEWFNISHIVNMSITKWGAILAIKPPEMKGDEYPDALSFLILEKYNELSKLMIKVLVTLNIDDTYVKVQNILDIVLTDINNFWLILKEKEGIRIIYYYKSLTILPCSFQDNISEEKQKQSQVKDQDKDESAEQYRYVSRILESKFNYSLFLANYEIPIFSIILENPNIKNEYYFYTGLILFKTQDINFDSNVILDINTHTIIENKGIDEVKHMCREIMLHTENTSIMDIYSDNDKYEYMREYIKLREKMKQTEYIRKQLEIISKKVKAKDIEKLKIMLQVETEKMKIKKKEEEFLFQKNKADSIAKQLLEEENKTKIKNTKQILKNKAKTEKKKLEKEILAKEEKERLETLEKAKLEKERLESLEKAKLEKERLENLVKVKLEHEKLAKAKMEKEELNCIISDILNDIINEVIVKSHVSKVEKDTNCLQVPKVPLDTKVLLDTKVPQVTGVKKINKNNRFKKIKKVIQVIQVIQVPAKLQQVPAKIQQVPKLEQQISHQLQKIPLLQQLPLLIEQTSVQTSVQIPVLSSIFNEFIYYINEQNYELGIILKHYKIMYLESLNEYYNQYYNQLLFMNRCIVMFAIDKLVINDLNIKKIKDLLDNRNPDKKYNSAIYGSYLSIIFSQILTEIGLNYNPFSKYDNPLEQVDIDTAFYSYLDENYELYGEDNDEFIIDKPILIGFNTPIKPIQNTQIKITSKHYWQCQSWDLNYTSALLLYEGNNEFISRHPDFTEFLFGIQPIQLLYGKTQDNLYNPSSTEFRLYKAIQFWKK